MKTLAEWHQMFFELPVELQEAVQELSRGATEVIHAHMNDADHGPQDSGNHFAHAESHSLGAWNHYCLGSTEYDSDGLEHWKHAAARLALACVRKLPI